MPMVLGGTNVSQPSTINWRLALVLMAFQLVATQLFQGFPVDLGVYLWEKTDGDSPSTRAINTSTTAQQHPTPAGSGYSRSPVVYGLVHVAKTAGSEINGMLASRYERVCGTKGNSYDEYQANLRFKDSNATSALARQKDAVQRAYRGYSRVRVPTELLSEVGFEDCDYISHEEGWKIWKNHKIRIPGTQSTNQDQQQQQQQQQQRLQHDSSPQKSKDQWIPVPMELHVPCRDPLNHIMSQCNHRMRSFNCNASNIGTEIHECTVVLNRFSDMLLRMNFTAVKCFNPMPPTAYVDYMGTFLQTRRYESQYVHRDTNRRRNKATECLWKNERLMAFVRSYLETKYSYYSFCKKCMGSRDEVNLTTKSL